MEPSNPKLEDHISDQLQSALELIRTSTIEDLAPLYEALGLKTFEHRKKSDDLVPLSIFPHALAIGGVYPAVELIMEIVDQVDESRPTRSIGYMLNKRERGDHGFADHWHIPGTVIRIGDDFNSIADRLFESDLWNTLGLRSLEPLPFLGVLLHYTRERNATAVSLFWKLRISDEASRHWFSQLHHWKLYKHESRWLDVVPYQEKLLRSIRDFKTPFFITLPGFILADAD